MVQEDLEVTQFLWEEAEGVWMRLTSKSGREASSKEPQP